MNPPNARWKMTKKELGLLSASLRPIRTCEEVGQIMGLSPSAIYKIENSALRKILLAFHPPQKSKKRGMNGRSAERQTGSTPSDLTKLNQIKEKPPIL